MLGDFAVGSIVDFKFTTMGVAGIGVSLSGGTVKAYKGNSSITETTTGITLTADFDGLAGLHHVRIDTSADPTFYAAGSEIMLVITAGTVDGYSRAGVIVESFSIENRSALRPATAGRTIVVSAGGTADAQVKGMDTDTLSATALAASAVTEIQSGLATSAALATVQADTDDIQTRLPAALVSGRMNASVGAMQTDTLTADALAADAVTEIAAAGGGATPDEIVDALLDELLAGHITSGSVGESLNRIDDIQAKTDLITSGNITIGVLVSIDGSFAIVKGDSYPNTEGRAIPFSVGAAPWPTDLTGYTISITIVTAAGTVMLTDTLTIVTATGASRSVRWEPTAAETATLAAGSWNYEVKATKSSEVARLQLGIVRVRQGTT